MKILVINTGSSSIKYRLFDMEDERALAFGLVERIGEGTGRLSLGKAAASGAPAASEHVEEGPIADHRAGLERIADRMTDARIGIIRRRSEIDAVGHRVVHGGESFQAPTVIDDAVLEAVRANIPLAPLHNPANLIGIEVSRLLFPHAPQVAVFDTAFHQTLPPRAYLYAIPYALYRRERIRRYGFHGTSHAYVAERAASHLRRPLGSLNIVTIHLGNGASMAAVKQGRCIDTTMGMTPLGGLVMGTRSGDLDPALPFFLANHLGMSLGEIDELLNKESGLKGLCGSNDMREVLEQEAAGDPAAALAVDIYTYRIRKYIGAYLAAMGGLDAVVFTAGIGENAPRIRERCCEGLACVGIRVDAERNLRPGGPVRVISAEGSPVHVFVVATNEELRIARETRDLLRSPAS